MKSLGIAMLSYEQLSSTIESLTSVGITPACMNLELVWCSGYSFPFRVTRPFGLTHDENNSYTNGETLLKHCLRIDVSVTMYI